MKDSFDDLLLRGVVSLEVKAAFRIAKNARESDESIQNINTLVDRCNSSNDSVIFRVAEFINLIIALQKINYKGLIISENNYSFFLKYNDEKDNIATEIGILNKWKNYLDGSFPASDLIKAYASLLHKCEKLSKDRDIKFLIVLQNQTEQ